ncbi:MAG: hypothetical protein SO170_03730 [Butyribacter sp.]|nr:hypothetical protein [bacterium]MDY3854064.1 hypothetical protein [Butyribacter sp.]
MAFWNRKKKKDRQQEMLEKEAQEKLEEIRQKKIFQRKKKQEAARQEEAGQPQDDMEKYRTEIVKPVYKNDQKRYVTECCQAIQEADHQIESIRNEYQSVTDYLLDIQKIERMGKEDHKGLLEAAKNIVRLTKERNQYKERNLSISDTVIRKFETYDEELVDEIKKMYDAEAYQKAIDGDLEKLQEEKKKLRQEKKEIIEKQNALKKIAKVLIVLIVSLFVLFVAIYYALHVDMTYPYLGTVLFATVISVMIFMESNRNRRDMTMAERKTDRAVSLLNQVKIKCVNNLNLLDYNKEKFGVKDAADFEQLWNEYCKAKEYERKFRENTEQLNYYTDELLAILKENQIKDCEVWIGQVLALVDSREMVEIRHDLNSRRQKLRERITYNEDVKKELVMGINEVLQENPESKEEFLEIVAAYSKK